jgi:hypothetical protein
MRSLLDQHTWAHAAAVSGLATPTTVDRLIAGLDEAHLRARPGPGLNSIAWILWHMARLEDVAVNVLVAGGSQVIAEDDWADRLRLPHTALGTGMDDAEVDGVSRQVDTAALLDYRMAVGRRTRDVMARLEETDLDQTVDAARVSELVTRGSIAAPAAWLVDVWQGQPLHFFLLMPATAHNFMHLGEAWCVRGLLGAGSGR